jgi:DnaJ-class molecular chaperone
LGVTRDASAEEIRRAYRAKAKAHHPDVGGSASSRAFELVKLAYEILKDPQRRQALDEPAISEPGQPHYHWSNIAGRPAQAERAKTARRGQSKGAEPWGFEEMYEAFFQTRIDQAAAARGVRPAPGRVADER